MTATFQNLPDSVTSDMILVLANIKDAKEKATEIIRLAELEWHDSGLAAAFMEKVVEVIAAAYDIAGDGSAFEPNHRWWNARPVVEFNRVWFEYPVGVAGCVDAAERGVELYYPQWEPSEQFLATPAAELAVAALANCSPLKASEIKQYLANRRKRAAANFQSVKTEEAEINQTAEVELDFVISADGLYYIAHTEFGLYRIDPEAEVLAWQAAARNYVPVYLDDTDYYLDPLVRIASKHAQMMHDAQVEE